jgi:predicted metal-dependent hydrolase
MHFDRGVELIRRGAYFDAHEELELAWRTAPPDERDFYQGLVHVAVAWYQADRGNRVGCERQLEKARRRLAPYAPAHRGVDVSSLLAQVDAAAARVATGSLALDRVEADGLERPVERDLEPPVPPEEEQEPERDERRPAADLE